MASPSQPDRWGWREREWDWAGDCNLVHQQHPLHPFAANRDGNWGAAVFAHGHARSAGGQDVLQRKRKWAP